MRLELFIIVDSGHHHDQISNFKTDNSHRRSGHCWVQSGFSVQSHSREQPADLRLDCSAEIRGGYVGLALSPPIHQGPM